MTLRIVNYNPTNIINAELCLDGSIDVLLLFHAKTTDLLFPLYEIKILL